MKQRERCTAETARFEPMGCARAFCWLCVLLVLAPVVHAGTIFDENWTPPAPRKAAATTKPSTTTAPATVAIEKTTTTAPTTAPTTAEATTAPTTAEAQTPPPPLPPPTTTAIAAAPPRRAVPDTAAQARSRALFKEVFSKELADRSAPARRALAARLLDEAAKAADVPADQFVLLAGATDAGREAADLPLCLRAADAMAAAYDVDGLQLKSDAALKMALRGDSPTASVENCRAGLELIDQLVEAEEYATAARLLTALRPVAAASGDPAIAARVQARGRDLDTLRTAADRVTPQAQRLKLAPDDPAANLAVGQFHCFLRGDWERGLPMLAKGSDAGLKALAAAELAKPADAEALAKLGDGWWAVASARHGFSHAIVLRHAAGFYQLALDGGAAGLRRAAIHTRRVAAKAVLAPVTPVTPASATATDGPAGPRSVLLLVGNGKEKDIFGPISNGKARIVSRKEIAGLLAAADPGQALGRYAVVVWGRNVFRDTPVQEITEAAQQAMQRYVRDGGDLVFFEQYAMGNMEIIEKLFDIKLGGGANGAQIVDEQLKARAEAAGYTDQTLKAIHFHNSYPQVPKEARVLIRGADNGNPATGAIVPYGKGRLILLGTNMDPADEKLDEEFFDRIYHYKGGRTGMAVTNAGAPAAVRPPVAGRATFLSDAQETDSKLGHQLLKGGNSFNGANTTVNGEYSVHALSTHAVKDDTAYVEYDLEGRFRSFTAKVGILDAANNPPTPLVFRVVGDGKTLWESKPVKKGERPTQSCSVDISGVKVLRLEVNCPGDSESGQAVWLEPQVR